MELRPRPRIKTAGELTIEGLKRIFIKDVNDSLRNVYITEDDYGRKVMNRRDLRMSLNYCLPLNRQLYDSEYDEVIKVLDPNNTTIIDVEQYVDLFSKGPEESKCRCFEAIDARPKPGKPGKFSVLPVGYVSPECEIRDARAKVDVLNKTAELIEAVNQSSSDDGIDNFGKSMIASIRKLDRVSQEEVKLEIQQILLRHIRRY